MSPPITCRYQHSNTILCYQYAYIGYIIIIIIFLIALGSKDPEG